MAGWPPYKALRVPRVGVVEDALTGGDDGWSAAMVDISSSEQRDARVVVALVVPVKKRGEEGAGILEGTEAFGHFGSIKKSTKGSFGEGVVVGDVRSTVGTRDAEVHVEQRRRFGGHRRAPVRVAGELARENAVTLECFAEKRMRHGGRLGSS